MKKQRKYDREFKINAVKLYRESGKTLEEVAPIMAFSYLYKACFSIACTPLFYVLVFIVRGKWQIDTKIFRFSSANAETRINFMNSSCDLSKKRCIPCRGGVPPLKGESLAELQSQLDKNWKVIDEHHLEREFIFKNFQEALAFTNKIGEVAEQEDHHPDILLSYGKVKVLLWTHKIDGLSESDFILAAKYDHIK